MSTVNLSDKLALFSDAWSPKAVGIVNDVHVKLVKMKGEFVPPRRSSGGGFGGGGDGGC